jgi:alpha-amylase
LNEKRAIYRFVEDGKNWAHDVGSFQGNADYLMLENLDYTNKDVVRETNEWGRWIMNELGLQGFRLDAVQHYSRNFVTQWAKHLGTSSNTRPFFMGEYWSGNVDMLTEWLDQTSPNFFLYDVPLMSNIARLSIFDLTDMREVFQNTLVKTRPDNAVVSLVLASPFDCISF